MNYAITDIDIEIYIGLVLLVNRIVAGFFTPIFDELRLSKKWLMYVAWILAAYIIFVTKLNLFAAIIPDPVVGRLLSAVAIGGGSSILHDASDNQPTNEYSGSNRVGSNPDASDR